MNDNPRMPLFGIVLYGSFPETIADSAKLLRRLGEAAACATFDAIEIPYAGEESTWSAIREAAARSGIHLLASAGPTFAVEKLTLCSGDTARTGFSIARIKKIIDFAYAVGSRSLLIMSGQADPAASSSAGLDILIGSLVELVSYCQSHARDYCITLSIEPADSDIQHKQFLGPSSRVHDLTKGLAARSVPIDITLDMSHIPQLGETIETATATLGDAVGHAHIANVVLDRKHALYGDRHPPFSTPGGVYVEDDIIRFIHALQQNCFSRRSTFCYEGPVASVEIRPVPEGQAVEEILSGASRLVTKAKASMLRS
jgi:sugar phosphate isomerase/epimerase